MANAISSSVAELLCSSKILRLRIVTKRLGKNLLP